MMSRKKRRARGCTSKRKHGDYGSAMLAVWEMNARTGDVFTAYECPFCRNWHVGHQ